MKFSSGFSTLKNKKLPEGAYENIIRNSQEGILVVSDILDILYLNETAKKMIPQLEEASSVKDNEYLKDVIVDNGGEIVVGDNLYEARIEPIELGKDKAYQIVLIDMTEHYRYMIEMEAMTEQANASNATKSSFLANMSHEIRTPLNAILGMDEMIIRSTDDASITKYARDIQSAGQTLLSIINDILDLSKVESGKLTLVPIEYEFSAIINDIVNMTRHKADAKGLMFNLTIDPKAPSMMFGDEIRVKQVILNIVNNAVKYTNSGSVSVSFEFFDDVDENDLTAETSYHPIEMVVTVKDTGIGIKEEDIGKLFGNFQRLDEKKNRNIEGTGLGLSISKRLAEMMDGFISVSSKYGEGTTFCVHMIQGVIDASPVGDIKEAIEELAMQQEEYVPSLVAPKAEVLIVDDNEMNLRVISGLLEQTRIRITTAMSGEECLEILEEGKFDIVFLDQMMPNMDGAETLSLIRSRHLCDEMPVIMLTADAVVGAREAYISMGFSDYLSKPVEYRQLETMLKKYLPEGRALSDEEAATYLASVQAASSGITSISPAIEIPDEQKKRILVIDSDTDNLAFHKSALKPYYNCTFVKSNEDAERFLSKHEVDFVLRGYKEPSNS